MVTSVSKIIISNFVNVVQLLAYFQHPCKWKTKTKPKLIVHCHCHINVKTNKQKLLQLNNLFTNHNFFSTSISRLCTLTCNFSTECKVESQNKTTLLSVVIKLSLIIGLSFKLSYTTCVRLHVLYLYSSDDSQV